MRLDRRIAWAFAASSLACLMLAGLIVAGLTAGLPAHAERLRTPTGRIVLFNGHDLKGWTRFIPHQDGSDPRTDPNRVFQVEDGMIHVSGQEFGGITTEDAFENYRLIVEFRWGTKKWPPREKAPRDSGILMHCTGPDAVWTKSIECQIQEHDCGDFWLVRGTTIEVDGELVKSYKKKKSDAEKPTGEWNRIEVVCDGDKITNIVNGVVVNEGVRASVTKGRILLQSEGAEVFYRRVELAPLSK